MSLSTVILAAGQGTRMRSAVPKVLHPLGGKPLLTHVVEAAQQMYAADIHVIYGHGGRVVPDSLAHLPVDWIEQVERLGTGHAVLQAIPHIPDQATVLVLYGDVPLIGADTLERLLAELEMDALALITLRIEDARGYGRIVRDTDGSVLRIVEERDATLEERAISEINTGILAVSARNLRRWLERLDNNNAQGEYYLTDIISMAVGDGVEVRTVHPGRAEEVMGINDRAQLAQLERFYQAERARELMLHGVTLRDPSRLDLRGEVSVGQDVVIDVNVILEGRVHLGDGVTIGPNTLIRNTQIADGVEVLANCVIEDSVIGSHSRIGPFARIRPETQLADHVHIGNFVEIKKSQVDIGSKINHLSYVGDSTVGKDVNVGAGTITCNYDGANKHHTTIGDRVFIGSDTQLVAPVHVGDGATIGAGSTITRDVPAEKLSLCRSREFITVDYWQRPVKKPRR